ncbi:MAG: hypothetical protein ACTHK8_06375 [Ginsengibacter sp.]
MQSFNRINDLVNHRPKSNYTRAIGSNNLVTPDFNLVTVSKEWNESRRLGTFIWKSITHNR